MWDLGIFVGKIKKNLFTIKTRALYELEQHPENDKFDQQPGLPGDHNKNKQHFLKYTFCDSDCSAGSSCFFLTKR